MYYRVQLPFISAFVIATYCVSTLLAGQSDKRLDIYWIDVEGGAATLVVTPVGESILVDTGLPKQSHVDRMRACIVGVAGLKQLDHLIISHYDLDHYGGAAGLSREVPIVNVYDNGKFNGMRNEPGQDYWTFRCLKRIVMNPGDEVPLRQSSERPSSSIGLRCIATRQQFIEPESDAIRNELVCRNSRQKEPDPSENANSMVLVLKFGDFRFFNATDLTWNLEANLVCPVNLVGEVDVYQVTHHGLDRSNNPLVLQSLKPTISVMNNGRTKGCAPEVFANLRAASSIQAMYQMYRNQRPDGNINNTATELMANREKGESGNYIKLSVAPDGKSYEVTIPATGHWATYATRSQAN